MIYMGIKIENEQLYSKEEITEFLSQNEAYDLALDRIRELYESKFKNDLIWHYPISESEHAGGMIIPVKEGFLWVPYHQMEKQEGALSALSHIKLLDFDDLDIMKTDFKFFADELYKALGDAAQITMERE